MKMSEQPIKKEIIWKQTFLYHIIKLSFEEAMIRPAMIMQVGEGDDQMMVQIEEGKKVVKKDTINLHKCVTIETRDALHELLMAQAPMCLKCLHDQDAEKYNIRLR